MNRWVAVVNKGKLPKDIGLSISALIAKYEGNQISIEIKKYIKKRSNRQNRYYFGPVISEVDKYFRSTGLILSKEDIHEILMKHVGKYINFYFLPDGTRISVRRSSKDLTTKEWEEYMELIKFWAAKSGFIIPDPILLGYPENGGLVGKDE